MFGENPFWFKNSDFHFWPWKLVFLSRQELLIQRLKLLSIIDKSYVAEMDLVIAMGRDI